MKPYCILIILCVYSLNAVGQADQYRCAKKSSYSLVDRLKNYPFNVASKIMLVSFHDTVNYIPFLNDTVCLSKLTERKILDKSQVDSLTDLMYNVGEKGNRFKHTSVYCYSPRNAIVFLNNQGNGFAFIEFDFECHKIRYSSQKIQGGYYCNDKFQMLQSFFARNGVRCGTVK